MSNYSSSVTDGIFFCKFGFHCDIVSDIDTRFTSGFYRELCHKLGIHQSMSTAWHPQSDGSTEVVNKVVETTIRDHVNHMQTNCASFYVWSNLQSIILNTLLPDLLLFHEFW